VVKYRDITQMSHCDCCGNLIPSPQHELVKEVEGKRVVVCSEKCFRVYETYKYPKYGK